MNKNRNKFNLQKHKKRIKEKKMQN